MKTHHFRFQSNTEIVSKPSLLETVNILLVTIVKITGPHICRNTFDIIINSQRKDTVHFFTFYDIANTETIIYLDYDARKFLI
ncbi:hypothetical protein MHYMCMPSP_00212 [Hyalomma marginatum]|uniref:Uncharacterized protein n=1 Tax=Hyalomma marginatum TaxID=34627 RepID=A0A8S4C4E5_9ACAR|nr:hypothetical protein MHYMCMPSP_00212 [Hyalomma marginatum]CAG7600319.1 hypothetical protein MHYMCMPASI_01172 [Hyalomma marginatum]